MNNRITAKRFCDAFRDQWNVKTEENADCTLNAYKKSGQKKKQIWLQEKLYKLLDMGEKVDARCREAENTEYLFLIGNRNTKWQLPKWRYLTVNAGHFSEVNKLILHPLS